MKAGRKLAGVAAGAVSMAAAGAVGRVAVQRHALALREPAADVSFGSLRSDPVTVVADDGVALHVEIDEPNGPQDPSELTMVFVHGFALTLDSWHFQRAAYRGCVRTVFYDQRSHGRSGLSSRRNSTIDQLGRDLFQVLEETAPGPVILVGHSMGGMTVLALAEQHPELFGSRIVGVALIATTAGGLDVHKVLLPFVPTSVSTGLMRRTVGMLARGHRAIDGVRRATRSVSLVATDQLGFGDDVPEEYVAFVDEMLMGTSFGVVADFYPNLVTLHKYDAMAPFAGVPTVVICGSEDQITAIRHSRTLCEGIPGATLVECEGAGHMVILERHDEVTEALGELMDLPLTAGR